MAYGALEQMLREHNLSVEHLSPRVRDKYSLRDFVKYVPLKKDGEKFGGDSRSNGERRIKRYLFEKKVDFEYERALVLEEENSVLHIRFPDFYLKEYGLVIEFNGSEGIPERDKRYEDKKRFYDLNQVRYEIIHKREMDSGTWISKLSDIIEREERMERVVRVREPVSAGEPAGCALALVLALALAPVYAIKASFSYVCNSGKSL